MPGVAFSPDSKLLASADGDGTVRLWNPATGQPVGAPIQAGAQTGVVAVAFSPDGKLLASAGSTAPCGCGKYRYSRIPMRRFAPTWDPDTARMEPVRLRRTAAEGLRLNARSPGRWP